MLALCLDRLAPGAQTLPASFYEVIVSDDGKSNEAKALIEASYPWVKWVEGPKRGPAANRNGGAALANGKWLVFTDDDCLPDDNWLQAYANAIAYYPESKAFEGAIFPDNWKLLKKDLAECPINTKGNAFWSANILVKRLLFEEVGKFDEQFLIAANEDQDLMDRIMEKTTIIFLKDALVVHPVRIASFKQRVLSIPKSIKNWRRYYRKNHTVLATLGKSLDSQFFALLSAVKYFKWRSAIYHLLCLICVIPVIILDELSPD